MKKKNSSKGMHFSVSPWLEYMRMNLEVLPAVELPEQKEHLVPSFHKRETIRLALIPTVGL
jgi:hypothetical protein